MPRRLELFDETTMKEAVLKVVKKGYSIRGVAKSVNLSYATLRKYVRKYRSTEIRDRKFIRYCPNYVVNQVYSIELENTLEKYLLTARKLHYGLTSKTVKRMSYDLAVKNDLRVPKSWQKNNMAGRNWLYGFLRRHPLISDLLSWSRKFRPPIKKQFNTTLEMAKPDVEEIIVPENDVAKYMECLEEDSNFQSIDGDHNLETADATSAAENSIDLRPASVVSDSKSFQGEPVIIISIKKSKKK